MTGVLDRECCELIRGAYAYEGEAAVTWDFVGDEAQTGVDWFVKLIGGVAVIVLPGTDDFLDVLRGLEALAGPFDNDFHGPVHPGAHRGMNVIAATIRDKGYGNNCVLAGHSLGAMRADIATAELRRLGLEPRRRVVFGEPKPGFERLRTVLAPVPAASYGNRGAGGCDPFLSVPLSFWPELYVRPCPLTWVNHAPPADDIRGPFAWHRIQYYHEALRACQSGLS